MVTSPNWMAPFHIARATAGPRAVAERSWRAFRHGRVRMITRARNVPASQVRVGPSTEDDERVDVDPPVPAEADLDRVRGDLRECGRPGDDTTPVHGSAQADRGPVDAVDVDPRGSAARAAPPDERHRPTRVP